MPKIGAECSKSYVETEMIQEWLGIPTGILRNYTKEYLV